MTIKNLLSAGLITALFFTSAAVAFADSGQNPAETGNAQQSAVTRTVTGNINIVNIKSDIGELKTTDIAQVQFDQDAYLGAHSSYSNKVGFSQRVELDAKGTLMMKVTNRKDSGQFVNFGLFYDEQLSKQVYAEGKAHQDGETKTTYIKVPAAGTYYLGVYSTQPVGSTKPFSITVDAGAAFISGGDRTVNAGETIAVGARLASGQKQVNYFKIKPSKTGYLQTQFSKDVFGSVALCNSSKKALSKETRFAYLPTYGVKKDTTYYIRVTLTASSPNAVFQLKTANAAISENSGNSKASAKGLKARKTVKGGITAGSAAADWYKLSLSSSRAMSVRLSGKTNDCLKATVYNSKGKQVSRGTLNLRDYSKSTVQFKSSSKLPKGTYYIKVYRGNAYSSGWYSLYWK